MNIVNLKINIATFTNYFINSITDQNKKVNTMMPNVSLLDLPNKNVSTSNFNNFCCKYTSPSHL